MELLLEEIQRMSPNLSTLTSNPLSSLGIEESELKGLIVGLMKKICEWKKTFQICDILASYYVGIELFSLFIVGVLAKLKYPADEQNLAKTGDLYAILSDYFDISIIAKLGENPAEMPHTQIYLFN